MNSKESLESDLSILRSNLVDQKQRESLERLAQHARKGQSYKKWGRRLFFGYGLANAVENWIENFSPSVDKPFNKQIPIEETKSVVAAWVRYNILKAVLLLFLSSSVTGVTAYFLYKQIKFQKEKEALDKRFFYLQVLYDSSCESRLLYSETESSGLQIYRQEYFRKAGKHSSETGATDAPCIPSFNHRQRSEAARLIVEEDLDVIVDLEQAHFENTSLSEIDFSEGFLEGAYFSGADLHDADLSYSDVFIADFSDANLGGANLEGIKAQVSVFSGANFDNANLSHANFTRADLRRASFEGANLENAILASVDLMGAIGLKCDQLTLAVKWVEAYRDPELACGETIPEPEEGDAKEGT